jgi:TetR/AcrR family transcriptional regulator, fatty acid metabolism regulator protein
MSIHSALKKRQGPQGALDPIAKNLEDLRRGQVPKRHPNSSPATSSPALANVNRNSDKYQRILDAAVAVFAEKGFFVSRISDIADRADVADGTVYLYFKNKDEILATAINTAFDGFMRTARAELEKLETPSERLRRLAFLHLQALGANRNMAVVFQMELRQSTRFLSEFSHEHLIEYFNLVRQAIGDGKAGGEFRSDLPEKIAANCFFGAIDEMVTSWVLSEKDYPLTNVTDPLLDILLNGMKTATSSPK